MSINRSTFNRNKKSTIWNTCDYLFGTIKHQYNFITNYFIFY